MIIYWEEGCELEFSDEFSINNVLFYIVDLLEEVKANYYNIYAFSDFFEETLKNMQDKRYQVVWKIFDNMIRDTEMKKAGEVIFVPEDKKEGFQYSGKQPKRRLISSWCIMDPDKKNNKARVTFNRYMALLGKKELRCKIFGF